MIFFIELLFAAIVALSLTILFNGILRRPRDRPGPTLLAALPLFVVLFFASWAGGVWLKPLGPALWGAYWLPFVLVGGLVSLLLASRRMVDGADAGHHSGPATVVLAVTGFFWILLITLILLIGLRYLLIP